jgi:hypothetical protein
MIMPTGSHPRKPRPPTPKEGLRPTHPGRGEPTGAPFPTAATVARSPEVSARTPFLTPSWPAPSVIAAAGHHAVRNARPAQADDSGAAHRHAIGILLAWS